MNIVQVAASIQVEIRNIYIFLKYRFTVYV